MKAERYFSQLDIASVVSHLIQLCEMTLGGMSVEGCKGFPERLCRELDRWTQGQIRLVLNAHHDIRDAPTPNEEGFRTLVRFGSETYGWLMLLPASDQPEQWYPMPGQRQSRPLSVVSYSGCLSLLALCCFLCTR
jgi:hypothetical protein